MIRIRAFSPKNQAVTRNSASLSGRKSERGGVIIIILIAIALFAALSFVFSKGNRNSASSIDDQKAKLYATEILNYFRAVKNVTDELQISNGCEPLDLSMWADWSGNGSLSQAGSDRSNNYRPGREDCSINLPEGGGLPMVSAPSSIDPDIIRMGYVMNGQNGVVGLGTDDGGEIMHTFQLLGGEKSNAICKAFNNLVGLEQEEIYDSINVSFFPSYFYYRDNATASPHSQIGDQATFLQSKQTACVLTQFTGAAYFFYQVLGST